MTLDKGISIKNIYYMLTYAYQVLNQSNYEEIAGEDFDNIHDLFAEILSKGVAQQLKQGLYREYVQVCESMPVLKGKLEINGTVKNRLLNKQELSCEYDELSENNIFNQILKVTMLALLHQATVKKDKKTALRQSLSFFESIDTIQPNSIKWSTLRFQRNNKNYIMLLNICFFVLDGLLLTTETGKYKMKSFSDEHMHRLYEKFILEYYRKHYPELNPSASMIGWNIESGDDTFLPVMQSDIMLENKEKVLIIDAKYYTKTMQEQFSKKTYHSNNFYQIQSYVTNKAYKSEKKVAGCLLYAKTNEEITPDQELVNAGHKYYFRTLDLSGDFKSISDQLNILAEKWFK